MAIKPWKSVIKPLALALAMLVLACAQHATAADEAGGRPLSGPVRFEHAAVAADHPLASRAGVDVLRAGGNVVDAAVATSFALSVVRPESCGIGGGGFMLIWNAGAREAVAIDYRERAPLRATREMFAPSRTDGGEPAPSSVKGHRAAAVPGTVAGLCFAQKHYGRLELKRVLQPAIRLARDGVVVDESARKAQVEVLEEFARQPEFQQRFRVLYERYLNSGKPWQKGDRFYSPQRRVLEIISEQGVNGFYRGPVAQSLVDEMQRGGGLIGFDDLHRMQPVVREAIRGRFRDYDVFSMPPPSSGGVALIETLNILSAYESAHPQHRLQDFGHNSAAYLHLFAESSKHAFADRAEYLGDADFAIVPVGRLIGRDNARRLASRIAPRRTLPVKDYGRFLPIDDGGTSHLSVIDCLGNAVACTETINLRFGSFVVDPEYGIVLNNEMDDFAAVPGEPNAFGLVQSEANAIQPGKKPLSSMTPTILVRDGRAVHALGASGGPRIISATLQVLLNLTLFRLTAEQAVAKPRMHHQWLPDALYLEPAVFERLRGPLEAFGHKTSQHDGIGVVQAVSADYQGLQGASDARKGGQAAGF